MNWTSHGGGPTLLSRRIRYFAAVEKASRPVVFAGNGVRLSGAHADFIRLVDKLNIPVVTGWNAHDAIWNDHPLFCGRPGTVGDRGGNFTYRTPTWWSFSARA